MKRKSDWGGRRHGSGRKKERVTVAARVSLAFYERLKAEALKAGLSLSRLVEDALKQVFKD